MVDDMASDLTPLFILTMYLFSTRVAPLGLMTGAGEALFVEGAAMARGSRANKVAVRMMNEFVEVNEGLLDVTNADTRRENGLEWAKKLCECQGVMPVGVYQKQSQHGGTNKATYTHRSSRVASPPSSSSNSIPGSMRCSRDMAP